MSEMMVRKQVYIPRKQNQLLKRLARQRGVSEAEVIRQALAREAEIVAPLSDSAQALAKMIAFADERKIKFAGQGESFQWNREDLYEERQNRWLNPEKSQ
jgi:hypothetical protein